MGIEHEFDTLFHDDVSGEPIEALPSDRARSPHLDTFFALTEKLALRTPNHKTGTGERWVLPNGGMAYQDMLNFEICSPECTSPREMVIHDKAMERIAYKALQMWRSLPGGERTFMEEKRRFDLKIYKKNTGIMPALIQSIIPAEGEAFSPPPHPPHVPISRAFHENYRINLGLFHRLHNQKSLYSQFWSLFLMTRYLFSGSGGIVCQPHATVGTDEEFLFAVSPRFFAMSKMLGLGTTGYDERAILCARESKDLEDNEGYERLHVICGDANMMEKSIWLTVGISSLILELMEHDELDETLRADPSWYEKQFPFNKLLKKLGADSRGETKLRLANGTQQTVLEVLWRYYYLCEKYVRRNAQAQHYELLTEWHRVLRELERDWRNLVGVLGWPTLKWIIEEHGAKNSRVTPLDDEELHQLNYDFHNIDPEESLYYELAGDFERVTTDEEIEEATTTPPETRAKLRAVICKHLQGLGYDFSSTWRQIQFITSGLLADTPNRPRTTIELGDPCANTFFGLDSKSRSVINSLDLREEYT